MTVFLIEKPVRLQNKDYWDFSVARQLSCCMGLWTSVTRLGGNVGYFSKPVATIILPKLPTFLGKFCKGVEIFHFSSEIIFGQLLLTFGDFLLVTLQSGLIQTMNCLQANPIIVRHVKK